MKTLITITLLSLISFNSVLANEICKLDTTASDSIDVLYTQTTTNSNYLSAFFKQVPRNDFQDKVLERVVTYNGIDYRFIIADDDTQYGVILNYNTNKIIATINDQDILCK